MKLLYSILFTFYMVFRPLVPLVEYAVNYNYIKDVLCINKNKPELHCNGKCYLSKALAKTNDTESLPLGKIKNSGQKILDTYILPEITEIVYSEKNLFFSFNFTYETTYSFLFLKPVFKPPVF
ncbi:hypothetical protein M9991_06515 [Chryseobacterium gallinarum]|uniref:hypothetical protein n=1 Tax=Chryseobacterium gallinarum TaxID=1324352 RepID=UPI002024F226|nr:hypothetical protein [Chryseobacterium gallinarum]MCL8536518.1 hypothetical protein [Chryseobacterium gallinarum]